MFATETAAEWARHGIRVNCVAAGMIASRLQDTGKNGSLVWLLMIPVLIANVVTFLAAMTLGFGLLLIFLPLLWLLSLISLCAVIYLVYLCVQPGTPGPNAYGPQPPVAA